ncbi:PREDICTED: ankyrin repeat domain-containing protein EMB506, chloroplastic-like [Ceratosolen solmsi marchali]|uniref:Ankyrin repeat domain-containing protein EMB506, chloroplastic-like n=1 Tax=Ceratosolen solmsi marchali TaxID=326594 RepID=A0AAJ7DU76_9HYME|nr:PREDICTED: ankyrin repeat domain-containing protein EMB506, chloroplastic-like [Ceratosolen solmsi marchali]
MVNKKLKVERASDLRCVPFTKTINEDSDFENEAMFLRDCSTRSEYEMCKKKQKLAQCDQSYTFHGVELEQDVALANSLFSQDFNDYQRLSILCATTREHFGDYNPNDPKYAELVRSVVRHNVNVNVDLGLLSQKSLHLAAMYDHTKMLEYLLAHQGIGVDDPDSSGTTALHVAAFRKNIAAMELLLRYGADPRVKSHEGLSPMFFAIRSGSIEAVELLASHGCDVNEIVVDRDLNRRYSHLHCAVERNHVKDKILL